MSGEIELDEGAGTPVWAAFGDLMSVLLGAFVLILVGVIAVQLQLSSKLDDSTHPLGPRRLCEAFVEACRDLDTDIKVKLIIYKLFERFVLNGLGQLYAESNRQLVDAGVLPQLKAIPQQVPSRSAKSSWKSRR